MPASKRTSNKKTGSVVEQVTFTISTLAARTGLVVPSPQVTRGGRLLSSSIHGGIHGGTLGDPQLVWGVSSADLSLAELEAFLELDGPLSPALIAEGEIASRGKYIRSIGTMDPSPGSAGSVVSLENHSQKGLAFPEVGEGSAGGWDWWVYNPAAATAFTAGAIVDLQIRNFVEWNPSG